MLFDLFLWLGVVIVAVPVAVFSSQVVLASFDLRNSHRRSPCELGGDIPTTVILMPAHNEAAGIAATLLPLKALSPRVRVLVVADNCTDDTASIARAHGVTVVERTAADLRGKGYALQHGLNHLRGGPPDVVIVLDADCDTTADDMHRLAAASAERATAVQGIYLMRAPPNAAIGSKIAEFAWLVKTLIRPKGWRSLGGTCQLMGSGFAVPWPVAEKLDLASGHLVEDMKLTMDLASIRQSPVFVECARVFSVFPAAVAAQATQRRRWEHGHLGVVLTEVPFALLKAASTLNSHLLAVALDLCVPPLSLLVLLLGGLSAAAMIQAVFWGVTWGSLLVCALAVALAGSVVLAWWGWGRAVLSARELLSVPAFVWRKLGVYVGFIWRREREWTRTDRD